MSTVHARTLTTRTHAHTHTFQKDSKTEVLLTANCKTENCNPTFKEVKKSKDSQQKELEII